jgi:Flp pilus assembly protein TadD
MAFYNGDHAAPAKVAAEKALAAAPHLPEAHLAMGHALMQLGDMPGAVRALREVMKRSPSNAESHWVLGMILMESGPLDDAAHALETAMGLDPALPAVARMLARVACTRRDWDRAFALLEQSRTTDGDFSYWTHLLRFATWHRDDERIDNALAVMKATAGENPVPLAVMESYGNRHAADNTTPLRELAFKHGAGWRRTAYFLQLDAEMAAFGGNQERMLSSIRLSAENKLQDLMWFDHCPLFDKYRSIPEFVQARAIVAARAQLVVDAYRAR